MSATKQTLPKGWRLLRLGDQFEIYKGRKLNNINYAPQKGDTRYIQIDDLRNDLNLKYTSDINGVKANREDLVIAWDGANAGEIGYGLVGFIGSTLAVLRPNTDSILTEYIARFLQTKFNYIHSNCSGATIPHVQKEILNNILIPLPPTLEEQKRIAIYLNEQMRHIEQARQAAEESLHAALDLSSKYLREMFDNNIANRWAKIRLGEILNLRKEIVHPYDNPKGQAVFVGLEHVEAHTGVRVGSVEVEMSKLTGRKPKFYKGDIVYGYLRPYLNKVWVAEFDGLCSVDQYVYSIDDSKVDVDFVAWFMRSPVYLERAPIDTTPGQLPRIRTEEVASVLINLPSLEEQKRISLQISEKLNNVNNLGYTIESQLAEINELPSALLRQAFAGEV